MSLPRIRGDEPTGALDTLGRSGQTTALTTAPSNTMGVYRMIDLAARADQRLSPTDMAILDATRACVVDFGVRRTTLTEVARRAGVSRPTVYRRWPDTGSLIAELLVRELRTIVAETMPDTGLGLDRLVRGIVAGAAAVRANAVFAKIFRTDTDLMLTYVFGRLGRNQRTLIELFATAIRIGQEDGSIRAGEPEQLAAMLLLIAQSAVQSAGTMAPLLEGAQFDTELARAIEGYLLP